MNLNEIKPVPRSGDAQDMSVLALFAASQVGAYKNENVYVIDGGRLGVMTSTY